MPVEDIQYSDKYYDEKYEYRHVLLPADIAKMVPRTHLLSETEWRNLGVQQSPGWVNYMSHPPGNNDKGSKRVFDGTGQKTARTSCVAIQKTEIPGFNRHFFSAFLSTNSCVTLDTFY
ncbi:unnamed protein product [Allacma fusca]|uniref:Cyclin-dependent kinases regulatory subunit n=1 Tax=Allacma fusca TaxID=39272 RepID=A0A8J2P8M0_9HEXA|nr:unnamed protein product [Allacma fusca]